MHNFENTPNAQKEKKWKLLDKYYETQTALKMHMEKEDHALMVNKLKKSLEKGGQSTTSPANQGEK